MMENSMNTGEYQFCGYPVHFPIGRQPFSAQKAIISKVLQALKEKKNALLESPTGTGKTLALLASTLAYQRHCRLNFGIPPVPPVLNPVPVKTESLSTNFDINEAKEETDPVPMVKSELKNPADNIPVKTEPPAPPPSVTVPAPLPLHTKSLRVFYCTRTHSQLAQVVDELRNCHQVYKHDLKMCVIGSRQHLCVNKSAKLEAEQQKIPLDEVCRELMDPKLDSVDSGCGYGLNQKRLKVTIDALNAMKVWDVEDAFKAGVSHRGCPYYSSRTIFEDANYVLAPYNYIIDPNIRQAMKIDLKDSVVIFDEAHNIEDVTREAASFEINRKQLLLIDRELDEVYKYTKFPILRDLGQVIKDLLLWIEEMAESLTADNSFHPKRRIGFTPKKTPSRYNNQQKSEDAYFGQSENIWDGDEFTDIFEKRFQMNPQTLAMYQQVLEKLVEQNDENEGIENRFVKEKDYVNKPIKLQYEGEKGSPEQEEKKLKIKVSSFSISTIRRYLRVFDYLLKKDKIHAMDYRICVQKKEDSDSAASNTKKRKSVSAGEAKEEITLHMWCLSGAVVFEEIAEQCHSVLLTSGTLSPLDSFAGELNTAFPIRVEASHVINLSKQLKVGLISSFNDFSLNSTYDARQSDAYLDTIGTALLLIAKQTPGGVLMFLPSYSLLNRCQFRWNQIKLLRKIEVETGANVYFEPKDTKEMKKMLITYYEDLNSVNSKAIMIGVCRGKVSEGINFSDHYCRAVIVVGIPFPSLVDVKIHLKREYQDIRCSQDIAKNLHNSLASASSGSSSNRTPYTSRNLSSSTPMNNNGAVTSTVHCNGSLWYKQQAFRAINQAVGRCIRHKDDFGAIILLDPRFHQEDVKNSLSRWMRDEAIAYERLEDFILSLKTFFQGLNSYEKLLTANPIHAVKKEVMMDHKDDDASSVNVKEEIEQTATEKDNLGDEDFVGNMTTRRKKSKSSEENSSSGQDDSKENNRNSSSATGKKMSDFFSRKNQPVPKHLEENEIHPPIPISISQSFQEIIDKRKQSADREELMKKYSPLSETAMDMQVEEKDNEERNVEFIGGSVAMDAEEINKEDSGSQSPFTIRSHSSLLVNGHSSANKDSKGSSLPATRMVSTESSKEQYSKAVSKESIPRVENWKLSEALIQTIRLRLTFHQNHSPVSTGYINFPQISAFSSFPLTKTTNLSKYLFPLRNSLKFLKSAFQDGVFLHRIEDLNHRNLLLVSPVNPEIDLTVFCSFAVLRISDLPIETSSAGLRGENTEDVQIVDYWSREDEVVYQLICYSNIPRGASSDQHHRHYQILFAKVIAASSNSASRQSETYGNGNLLPMFFRNSNDRERIYIDEEDEEDAMSDLSDSVVSKFHKNSISSHRKKPMEGSVAKAAPAVSSRPVNPSHTTPHNSKPIIIDLELTQS